MNRDQIIIAISSVLEHGDEDQQPWAFYEHDHGGLKGYDWTRQQAEIERSNFYRGGDCEVAGGREVNHKRSDSWIEIGIYIIWVVAAIVLVGGIYVAVHFIRKFW